MITPDSRLEQANVPASYFSRSDLSEILSPCLGCQLPRISLWFANSNDQGISPMRDDVSKLAHIQYASRFHISQNVARKPDIPKWDVSPPRSILNLRSD